MALSFEEALIAAKQERANLSLQFSDALIRAKEEAGMIDPVPQGPGAGERVVRRGISSIPLGLLSSARNASENMFGGNEDLFRRITGHESVVEGNVLDPMVAAAEDVHSAFVNPEAGTGERVAGAIADTAGHMAGALPAFVATGAASAPLKAVPYVGDSLAAAMQFGTAMGVTSPEEEQARAAIEGAILGPIFHGAGRISSGLERMGTQGLIGYGGARLAGAEPEEALGQGVTFGALGAMKQKHPDQIARDALAARLRANRERGLISRPEGDVPAPYGPDYVVGPEGVTRRPWQDLPPEPQRLLEGPERKALPAPEQPATDYVVGPDGVAYPAALMGRNALRGDQQGLLGMSDPTVPKPPPPPPDVPVAPPPPDVPVVPRASEVAPPPPVGVKRTRQQKPPEAASDLDPETMARQEQLQKDAEYLASPEGESNLERARQEMLRILEARYEEQLKSRNRQQRTQAQYTKKDLEDARANKLEGMGKRQQELMALQMRDAVSVPDNTNTNPTPPAKAQTATVDAPKPAAKQPWEMTREEFENSHIFRGVNQFNAEMHNTFWGGLGIAQAFARMRNTQGNVLRVARKSDVPQDLLWEDDNPVSVDKLLAKYGEIGSSIVEIPVRYEIPKEGIDNPHRYFVQQALSEGKPVPPEVLADYPDLAPKVPGKQQETFYHWSPEPDPVKLQSQIQTGDTSRGAMSNLGLFVSRDREFQGAYSTSPGQEPHRVVIKDGNDFIPRKSEDSTGLAQDFLRSEQGRDVAANLSAQGVPEDQWVPKIAREIEQGGLTEINGILESPDFVEFLANRGYEGVDDGRNRLIFNPKDRVTIQSPDLAPKPAAKPEAQGAKATPAQKASEALGKAKQAWGDLQKQGIRYDPKSTAEAQWRVVRHTAEYLYHKAAETGRRVAQVAADLVREMGESARGMIRAAQREAQGMMRGRGGSMARPASAGQRGAIGFRRRQQAQMSPAERHIEEHIDRTGGSKEPYTLKRLITDTVDDLFPLKKLEQSIFGTRKGADKVTESLYKQARLFKGWAGLGDVFLNHGTRDAKGNQTGDSLRKILQPVEDSGGLDAFERYLVAHRSIELRGRDVETGIDPVRARQAIQDIEARNPHFARAKAELKKYQDALVDYMVESGVLSQDAADAMRVLNRQYIPFYRAMEGKQSGTGPVDRLVDVFNPVKRIHGSDKKIVSPLESVVKNTYAFLQLGRKAQIGEIIADYAGKPAAQGIITKVRTPVTGRTYGVDQVSAALRRLGIEVDDTMGVAQDFVTLFGAKGMLPEKGAVSVLRGGKREFYQVPPDVWTALEGLNKEQTNIVMKVLSQPASLLRLGATLTPEFALGRNPVRDAISSFIYSDYGILPGVNFGRGLFHAFKKDDLYWDWKASGGEHAAFVSLDRKSIRKTLRDVIQTGKLEKVGNIVRHPIETLRIISEFTENANRLGEFSTGMKKELAKGTQRPEALARAGFASREVSQDFSMMGAKIRAVNQISAFEGARIGGYTKLWNSFRDHPTRSAAKAMAAITLPSITLMLLNRDDPRWEEIPQWQKDLFWIVMTEENIYRIPKPFEIGIVFGSIPERIVEGIVSKDPSMAKKILKSVSQIDMPIPEITALNPLMQNYANKDWTGKPLVGRWQENIEPEMQYGRHTSEAAKILGKWANYSPAKIDNLISGYTGGLGKHAVGMVDAGLKVTGAVKTPTKPSTVLADIPLGRGFVIRNPSESNEIIQKFYESRREADKASNTVKTHLKAGRRDEAVAYIQKHRPQLAVRKRLDKIANDLADKRKKVDAIYRSDSMSAEEKRVKVDMLVRQMTRMAKAGNTLVERMEKIHKGRP